MNLANQCGEHLSLDFEPRQWYLDNLPVYGRGVSVGA